MGNRKSNIDFKKVGIRIKAERERRNWSQEEFAKMLGATQQLVSGIELATTKVGLTTLHEIAYLFDVNMDYLLSGTAPKTESYLRDDMQDILNQCSKTQEAILVELFLDNARTVMKYEM